MVWSGDLNLTIQPRPSNWLPTMLKNACMRRGHWIRLRADSEWRIERQAPSNEVIKLTLTVLQSCKIQPMLEAAK
jgi:hypothetical protein